MRMRLAAALAATALGLLAAGCNPAPPAPPPEPKEPAPVANDERFNSAVNFECEGGAKLDVVFGYGAASTALTRIDGKVSELPADARATSGMVFKDDTTTLNYEGETIQLTQAGKTTACKFVSRSLPPPKVDGVIGDITADKAGTEVTMK